MAVIQIKIPNWLDRLFTWPVLLYRLCKYRYTYRKISLGEGKFTIVDPPDFYRFDIFNWCPKEHGPNIYAARLAADPQKKMRIKIVTLHREIMNHPAKFLVDHRNGDGLDNRRDNLRIATHRQNTCNRRKTKSKTSSRFIGVCFYKNRRLWRAGINCHGKRIFLGYFKSEIDAAHAYDKAALKYRKEFARLNFPILTKSPQSPIPLRFLQQWFIITVGSIVSLVKPVRHCVRSELSAGPGLQLMSKKGRKCR